MLIVPARSWRIAGDLRDQLDEALVHRQLMVEGRNAELALAFAARGILLGLEGAQSGRLGLLGGRRILVPSLGAVLDIVKGVPLNVTIKATDEKNDAGDALQFLDYLEVNVSGQGSCSMVSPTADTDNHQKDDAFPALLGGTPVCWNVHPVDKQSTTMPTTEPQLFKAKLTVSGDGSPLDTRAVFFLVPPKEPEVPQGPK